MRDLRSSRDDVGDPHGIPLLRGIKFKTGFTFMLYIYIYIYLPFTCYYVQLEFDKHLIKLKN